MHIPTALQRFARPTVGGKFALFCVALVMISLANGSIVAGGFRELEGTAAAISAASSLRSVAERLQLDAFKLATGRGGDRKAIEADLDRFDQTIRSLRSGGTSLGTEIPPAGAGLRAMIDAIGTDWEDIRDDLNKMRDDLSKGRDVAAALDHVEEDCTAVLARIDAALIALAGQKEGIGRAALRNLYLLLMLDFLLLAGGLLGVHFHVVRPLRQLVEASRKFAGGEYKQRIGVRLKDEIGELGQAFNHMADQIESDVAQLRSAHHDLHKLSQAIEQSPATVIITDPDGIIEYVNPKFTEITGYSPEEAVGRKLNLIQSGITPPQVYVNLWETILSGREWRGELLNRKKNGEFFWDNTRIAPLKDEQGRITHFVTVKEDVTHKKQAEEEIAQLNADLERRVAERTQQLSSANKELVAFSYSVAHDLRAPLRSINGFANLMATDTCKNCSNREAVEFLQRVQRASMRMGDLIDDLLNLSRVARSRIKTENVDLSDMARSILLDLAISDPGRKVATEVQDGILVTGDPALLRILLENLLGNAWKFTLKQEKALIAFCSRQQDDEQVVFVKDNGAGFDMRYADKLFGAFQRLHGPHEFEGSGIGLATVQRVINLHGGRIWAEGHVGKGATFNFVIPNRPDGAAS